MAALNPWILLALGAAWVGSAGGAFWYGTGVGEASVLARQKHDDDTVRKTREAAQKGAADAIAQIKITNTTVHQRAETVVREHVVYGDCRHVDGMLDRINEAITGRPQRPGDSKLPGTVAPGK